MPKVKLYVEVEVMDDKHCNGCNRKSYSSYKDTYYCELNPEYSYPLNKDKIGFLRTPECLESEVKEAFGLSA